MSSWLFCAYELSLYFSGEITTKFSLLYPPKQAETLKELLDSNMSLFVPLSFMGIQSILNKNTLAEIVKKYETEKTILPMNDLTSQSDWITSISYGKAALFLFEVPIKLIVINHRKALKPNSKFRYIEER